MTETQNIVNAEIVVADESPAPGIALYQHAADFSPETIASRISDADKKVIDQKVSNFVAAVKTAELETAEWDRLIQEVGNIGMDVVKKSTEVSSRLLDGTEAGSIEINKDTNSHVAENLVEFRRVLDKLDPSKRRKILGLIPWGDHITDMGRRWESSQTHLEAIIKKLQTSETNLKLDNQALEVEKQNLREQAQNLLKFIYMSNRVQVELEGYVAETAETDAHRAMLLRSYMQPMAIQQGNDLITHAMVMAQNFQGLNLTLQTNKQLVRNLERARTTTISALRGAVLLRNAQARLADAQRQVQATQDMTADYIVKASEDVRKNAGAVAASSNSLMIDVDALQKAYNNIMAATKEVEQARAAAVEVLTETQKSLEQLHLDASSPTSAGSLTSGTRASAGSSLSL